ncbi:MAG: hypothetical protein LWW92_17880, partial [Rhodocyclales bacterium]|nr:hypothetical protein [Rhodocyclales bacterium]
MSEHPIIFNGPMVRAILAGHKTQTRRLLQEAFHHDCWAGAVHHARETGWIAWWPGDHEGLAEITREKYKDGFPCPYGRPGDHLWVREAHRPVVSGQLQADSSRVVGPLALSDDESCVSGMLRYGTVYQADGAVIWQKHQTNVVEINGKPSGPLQFRPSKWSPSIHMRRTNARILLKIEAVRVQRVQDISEADAVAEGMEQLSPGGCYRNYQAADMPLEFARTSFYTLWESINAKRLPKHMGRRIKPRKQFDLWNARSSHWPRPCSWAANPWVWVSEF